ncbi:CDC27 family protein [Sulfurimonas sp. CVO]|jgi:tetratricopeptide (TPR) repeat protein|uniref:CDC27 family protein n=1 Tax=Sulfurimonas sp. CVO TaxID=2283483 RepID=UPI001F505130|nr:CDC27 family protein [Sulfurimonas sp. CVO]
MLNIDDLEIRHKKYKQKKIIPYFTITASIIIVSSSIAFFTLYNFNSNIEKKNIIKSTIDKKENIILQNTKAEPAKKEEKIIEQEKMAEPAKIEEEIIAQEPKLIKEESLQKQEKVMLSPSLKFIDNIKAEKETYSKNISNNIDTKKEIKKVSEEKKTALPVEEPAVEEVKESLQNVNQKSSISITRNDDEKDIQDVIKRFNINHNPALSLFVAKKYYQLGDYEQAYNYALATNELNNNIEASWIIFSKSLVKLDKKDMAIDTLRKYINYSNSSQAKQLLDEILSGKFK